MSKSIWNAVTNLAYVALNGLLGLIAAKFIIKYFGSDINGINSSSFQLVNILLVLEGGLTLATNVALFAPIHENNKQQINAIISATNKRFKKIGIVFFVLGTLSSLFYSFFIHTEVSYWLVVYFFMMSLLPAAVNLTVTMKYRSLLLSHQKEYVVSIITLITIIFGYSFTIVAIYNGCGVWSAKAFTTFFSLLNSVIIVMYCRRNFSYLDLKVKPDYDAIKGTKDVLMGKISGALFTAMPILMISVIFPSGAKLASVYAVYASVYSFLSNAIQSFSSAPRFAFGQLFVEGDINKIGHLFLRYELIVYIFQTVLMGCAISLILAFVDLYTVGVTDIEYHNAIIAFILGVSSYISVVHKPSGHMINMSGDFRTYKIINIYSVAALFIFSIVGYYVGRAFGFELYAVLIAFGLAELVKSLSEIIFAHKRILHLPLSKTFRLLMPNFILFVCAFYIGFCVDRVSSFLYLTLLAIVLTSLLVVVTLAVNWLINKKVLLQLIDMLKIKK